MEKRKNPICKAVRHQIAHFSFTMLRQPECKRTFQDKKVGSGVADNLETMVTVGMICINLPEYQCAYI